MTKKRLCGKCGELVDGSCSCRVIRAELRPNSNQRGYGTRWKAFRKRYWLHLIKKTGAIPVCARCGKSLVFDQVHFDHIDPVASKNDARFYDPKNIQLLHRRCHAEKTAEDIKSGKARSYERGAQNATAISRAAVDTKKVRQEVLEARRRTMDERSHHFG